MPQIALPIRLYERRKGYSPHSPESTLSGLSVRLEEDKYKNLEDGFPTSVTLSILGQKMRASIYAFKRDQEEKYKKDEGIIFIVNGQTHGRISKDFFTRSAVKMGYLANSILIIVDCSEIDGRAREDLFMNSRDRLSDCELKTAIEKKLEDEIKNHQGLQELRERRRREDIQNKLKDDKPLADVIENLLKKSPALSNLLSLGGQVKNPFKIRDTDVTDTFRGRQFPTIFTLIEKYPIEKPKNCHINTACRVKYKTDARNDYFDRDVDPGSLTLEINGIDSKDYSLNLWNGVATLTINLPHGVTIGDLLKVKSLVTDKSQMQPFIEEFTIRVIEPQKEKQGTSRSRIPPSSKEPGNKGKNISHMNIPNVIEVSKDEWDKHRFDKESALKVVEAGENSYDFYVNIDNVYLKTEQKYLKIDPNLLKARFKYGMVVIGIAFLSDYERKQNKQDETKEEDIFSLIYSASKIIAPFLLPMIAELGELEIEEGPSSL